MKQVILQQIKNTKFPDTWFLQLNRYIYILKQNENKFNILKSREYPGSIKMQIFEDLKAKNEQNVKDMIAIMNEKDKAVQFFSLHDFIEKEEVSEPLYQYKNWKKVTCIQKVSQKMFDKDMEGLIIGDKVGEIYFLNMANLDKLPKYTEEDLVTLRNRDQENVVKLLYGMQQSLTGVGLSSCNRYMFTFDTLNKVVVNNFPNVFEIQTVNTEHQEELKAFCQAQDCIVTVSQDAEKCRFMKQNIQNGNIMYEQIETASVIDKKVEQIFYTAEHDKVIAVSKNSGGKYEVDEIQEGKGLVPWQSGYDSAKFNGCFIAQDCMGKSTFILQANYDAVNGCLQAKDHIELVSTL